MSDFPITKPMRHRWHFSRKRETYGDVRCTRCRQWKPPPKYWYDRPCHVKFIVVRDRRAA